MLLSFHLTEHKIQMCLPLDYYFSKDYKEGLHFIDEGTSALDNESEHLVSQSLLDRLAVGRTTLTIAHRLTTIQNADRILVLNDSNIVEEGNHEELLLKRGMYYQLYTSAGEEGQAALTV